MTYKQVPNKANYKLLAETKAFPSSGRKVLSSTDVFKKNEKQPPLPQTNKNPHQTKQKRKDNKQTNQTKAPGVWAGGATSTSPPCTKQKSKPKPAVGGLLWHQNDFA